MANFRCADYFGTLSLFATHIKFSNNEAFAIIFSAPSSTILMYKTSGQCLVFMLLHVVNVINSKSCDTCQPLAALANGLTIQFTNVRLID